MNTEKTTYIYACKKYILLIQQVYEQHICDSCNLALISTTILTLVRELESFSREI